MTLRFPPGTRNANADATVDLFDAGAGAATIQVRTGAQPAAATDPATGTLLWTWTLADPSWGASAVGVSTLDATPVITAVTVAGGTAGWFRALDSNGNTVLDGAVGAELVIDNPLVVLGQTVNLNAGTYTTPAS